MKEHIKVPLYYIKHDDDIIIDWESVYNEFYNLCNKLKEKYDG